MGAGDSSREMMMSIDGSVGGVGDTKGVEGVFFGYRID